MYNETFCVRDSAHRYAVVNLFDRDELTKDDCIGRCAVDLSLIGAVPKTCYVPVARDTTLHPLDPFDLPSTGDAFGARTAFVGLTLLRSKSPPAGSEAAEATANGSVTVVTPEEDSQSVGGARQHSSRSMTGMNGVVLSDEPPAVALSAPGESTGEGEEVPGAVTSDDGCSTPRASSQASTRPTTPLTSPMKRNIHKVTRLRNSQRSSVKVFDREHSAADVPKLRAVAENVFRACNVDDDGKLNLREFTSCVKALGYEMDADTTRVLFDTLCAAPGATTNAPVDGLSLEAFAKYVCTKPLRAVVSAADCMLVRRVFESFDVDKSNALSDEEMKNCIVKVLGLPEHHSRVRRVLQNAAEMRKEQEHGAEGVDFITFFDILIASNVLSESRMMAVTDLFKLIDADNSGALVHAEVSVMLSAAGITDEAMVTLLREFGFASEAMDLDQIHSRTDPTASKMKEVGLERFLDVVVRADDREIPGTENFSLAQLLRLKRAFTNIDRDGSGAVSIEELSKMAHTLKLDVTSDDLEELMEEADVDGDGEIQFSEYLDAVSRGVLAGTDAAELFNVKAMSEVSTYLLSHDEQDEVEELAQQNQTVDFLERRVVPMITRMWTARRGGYLGMYDIAYKEHSRSHFGDDHVVDFHSGVVPGDGGKGGKGNRVAPGKPGKLMRLKSKAQVNAQSTTASMRPISDEKVLAVWKTRNLCIANCMLVALISSVSSAIIDIVANDYFPIDQGQGTNYRNHSWWRYYALTTIPACTFASIEVGTIYYLALYCALTFSHIVGLVLYPVNEERKYMIRSIIHNCFEMPYPNNNIEGINPLRGYSRFRILLTLFLYR